MSLSKSALTWVAAVWSLVLWGQSDPIGTFKKITTQHGLSQDAVTTIIQDQQGFIWVGTEDGLNRFDGYTFVVYRHDPTDPNSLSNNEVTVIYEDLQGALWVGTDGGGLNRFDRDTQQFTHFRHLTDDAHSLAHDVVSAIIEDRQGRLWVGTEEGGLNLFDRSSAQFHHPVDEDDLSSDAVTSLCVDGDNLIWVGTENGLNRVEPTTLSVTAYRHDHESLESPASNIIQALHSDSDGFLWVAYEDAGIDRFDPKNQVFSHYPAQANGLSHEEVVGICEDTRNKLWLATEGGGLNGLDKVTGRFTCYRHDDRDSQSLSNDIVTAVFQDRSGLLWVGTEGGGLNQLALSISPVRQLKNGGQESQSLSGNNVLSVYQDRTDAIWIGTQDEGLNCYDPRSGQVTHYRHDVNAPHSISHNDISAIYQTSDGTLWVGTDGGGLNRYDPATQSFQPFRPRDSVNGLKSDEITSILEDSSGIIWIGTDGGGLHAIDLAQPTTRHFGLDPQNPHSLSHDKVMTLLQDHRGNLWVGTEGGGLNRFDSNDRFARFNYQVNNPLSLSGDDVFALCEDSSGRLWVGTNVGLNLMTAAGEFRYFLQSDGLPSALVYGIFADDRQRLWIVTSAGLAEFDPQNETFDVHPAASGLFNRGAHRRNREGQLLLGGTDGLTIFNPSLAHATASASPVVLTDFQIYNQSVKAATGSVLTRSISQADVINLSHRDDLFTFEFSALDYANPEGVQYSYMMEGYDNQWHFIGSRRMVDFTNMPAGSYIFHVKGGANSNNEGVARVKINIAPPIWRTWPAYLLYVLAFASALSAFIRLRTRSHRRQIAMQKLALEQERKVTERLRQIDRLKDHFLASTSHELRTPLTGMIGLADSLLDGVAGVPNPTMRRNLAMIVNCGQRLAGLVNDILDFSTLKTRQLKLQLRSVDLKSTVDAVLALNAVMVKGKNVDLINAIPEGLVAVHADENRLVQILHNLTGNAAKFTHAGHVHIDAQERNGRVQIEVSDTGIGIPNDKFHSIFQSFEQVDSNDNREYGGTGLGLHITQQLIELHGGSIRVSSELDKGSTFSFDLAASAEPAALVDQPIFVPKRLCHMDEMPKQLESSTSNNGFRVLVVDDEPANLQVLGNHLRMANYRVEFANSGKEALASIKRTRPDLVLLDVMMPKMTGFDVCKRIRKSFAANELPVIFLTAKNQIADLVAGFQLGANDYLAKPFAKNELLARVKTHLEVTQMSTASGRFVPRQFLDNLNKDSILDIKLGDHVQKEMTVLFSDIRSFTTLSEQMTPEENFRFVNDYFGQMGPLVREHGGFIDKFIGDAVMALFDRHPDDALDAAIAMLQQLERNNHHRQQSGLFPINVGIGINTGHLMLGTIGEADRMEGTVISDAVNLASRLEGLTKNYGVPLLISEYTRQALQHPDNYQLRPLGEVHVKGKLNAVAVFEVLNGHGETERDKRWHSRGLFENAVDAYQNHDLGRAAALFHRVLEANPNDRAARFLYNQTARSPLPTLATAI